MRLGGDETAVEEDRRAPCPTQRLERPHKATKQPSSVRRRRKSRRHLVERGVVDAGREDRPGRQGAHGDKVGYHPHTIVVVFADLST